MNRRATLFKVGTVVAVALLAWLAIVVSREFVTHAEGAVSTNSGGPSPAMTTHHVPTTPFRTDSIWRRPVASDAKYLDINDVTGVSAERIIQVGPDLVTLCDIDPEAPLVDVQRSLGWTMPARSQASGTVLYRRRLAADACTELRWNPSGNGLFVLYDRARGTTDLGVGGWRDPGGPLLNSAPDGPSAHGLNVVDGDGLVGYGRASGLPALGGLLRPGELKQGIPHALAVNLSTSLLSKDKHYVWPARSADAMAPITYRGKNPGLALGSLLAIPPSIDLSKLQWQTTQGRILALASKQFGWYVVDSHNTPGLVQFGMENDAARRDLGLIISADGKRQTVDPAKLDYNGFLLDVAQVFGLLRAIPQSR